MAHGTTKRWEMFFCLMKQKLSSEFQSAQASLMILEYGHGRIMASLQWGLHTTWQSMCWRKRKGPWMVGTTLMLQKWKTSGSLFGSLNDQIKSSIFCGGLAKIYCQQIIAWLEEKLRLKIGVQLMVKKNRQPTPYGNVVWCLRNGKNLASNSLDGTILRGLLEA